MMWVTAGITLALAAMAASLGGLGIGLIALGAMAWLLVAFRPVEAGAMVAGWSRRRFEQTGSSDVAEAGP
jgi:hypothetical protein